MQIKAFLLQITFASVLTRVSADCQLSNKGEEAGTVETNESLCKPQGEGDWTFAMAVSQTGFPVFNGGSAFAGMVGNFGFAIYDHTCTLKSNYDPGEEGNDCGTPYVIKENFLDWVIDVTSVMASVGDSDFVFYYGNGKYSIGNNHCGCSNEPDGLQGYTYCKCAFPVNGRPSSQKREIEFKA